MTTRAQLRKAALAQPETEESGTRAAAEFLVAGTRFAAVEDGQAVLHLPTADADEVLRDHPSAARAEEAGGVVVRVPLADIGGMALNHWVRRAWASRAPAGLVREAEGASSAEPGEVGDLPREIGRPATRALAGAGITSLAEVAARSDAELLDLHGVGPKALRLLRAAAPATNG
ncbi:hypothetical protein ACPYO6_05120 [Georgenia sp. Z1344]|uniref:hypothetical protein n=1 Tax=Georgenia sp. Z1344 TaxID=3416706 RepID=UPI003CF562D0